MALRPSEESNEWLHEEEFPFPPRESFARAAGSPSLVNRNLEARRRAASSREGTVVHLSLYKKIATIFVAIALILLGLVLYISLARATVFITPRVEAVTEDQELVIEPEPKKDGLSAPGWVLATIQDASKTVPVVGGAEKKTIDGVACGTVTLINKQTRSQPLVATTRLLTKENVLFRIKKSVTVPANGSLDTEACADVAGASGDIGPSSFTIPGLPATMQAKTYAESKAAMSGGTKTIAVVSAEEVKKATEVFTEELVQKGLEQLKALLPKEQTPTGVLYLKNIVKNESDAKPGTEQDHYTISLSVHVKAVFYDPMALGQAAAAALRGATGSKRTLLSVNQNTLSPTLLAADAALKQARVKVSVSGNVVADARPDLIDKEKIAGLGVKDAVQYLRTLPFVSDASVELHPFWARTIPSLKDHIDIVIQSAP